MRWLLLFLILTNGVYFFAWQNTGVNKAITLPENVGSKFKLLSEVKSIQSSIIDRNNNLNANISTKEATKPITSNPEICNIVGPFSSVVAQSWAQNILKEQGVESESVLVTDNNVVEYYVVLSQTFSRKMPDIIESLRANGIDAYRKHLGQNGEHVLLGHFNKKAKARAYIQYVKSLGFSAKLIENVSAEDSLWLQLADTSPNSKESRMWQTLTNNFSELEQKKTSCQVKNLVASRS